MNTEKSKKPSDSTNSIVNNKPANMSTSSNQTKSKKQKSEQNCKHEPSDCNG